jgi:hypothetical protein
VNVAEAPRSATIPVGKLFGEGARLRAIYGEGEVEVAVGQVKVDLPAREGVVLEQLTK